MDSLLCERSKPTYDSRIRSIVRILKKFHQDLPFVSYLKAQTKLLHFKLEGKTLMYSLKGEGLKLFNGVIEDFKNEAMRILEKCNQTAVVTNEFDARELAAKLKQRGKLNVYFGEKLLLEKKLGFHFHGHLTCNHLHKRIKGAEASGISNWLNGLAVKHIPNINWNRKEGLKMMKMLQV